MIPTTTILKSFASKYSLGIISRSARITDHVGHTIAVAHREGLFPLMTPEESSRAAVQAAIRAATRDKFKSKIGGIQYSISRYVNLVRTTVPIRDGTKNRFLLLITFDIDSEAGSIIQKKILPYIEYNRRYFPDKVDLGFLRTTLM